MTAAYIGVIREGRVEFETPVTLPEGSQVVVLAAKLDERTARRKANTWLAENAGNVVGTEKQGVLLQAGNQVVWRFKAMEVQSRLKDLSPQGAFIESDTPPEIGSSIFIYIPASESNPDSGFSAQVQGCQATVVHRTPIGFGLEFVFPSDTFSSAVEQIIRAADL